jgi:multidrug efflux pump subunit AcrA (membrane-fusion protein)
VTRQENATHRRRECKLAGFNVHAQRRNHWPHKEIEGPEALPAVALLPENVLGRDTNTQLILRSKLAITSKINALHIPENDAAGVPEGTQVNFTVPTFPGRTFHVPVARISHGIDTKTRTMPVELDVQDPRAELVPGTFCEVEWPVHRTYPTLFVPFSAVASDLERTFVIRVTNNRTEWVDVRTGVRAGDVIEVFGNLHSGDEVATHGSDQLRAGVEVSTRFVTPKQ